jgi:putative inorganic carbon (hco3(-)) transporter
MINNIKSSLSNFNDKKIIIFVTLISVFFLCINLTLIAYDFYFFAIIPFLIILAYLYFTTLDLVFFIAVFATPLSFELVAEEFNLGLSLPSEPLLFGILIFFILKLLGEKPLSRSLVSHPVSLFVMLQMGWMFITILTSQLPFVSFKYWLMQLWFVFPVFFFGHMVMNNKKRIHLFFILLIVSVSLTVFYTTINHAFNGFSAQSGKWVMYPFYNDHTAYGAVLALLLPVVLGLSIKSNLGKFAKTYLLIASAVMMIGIFLSYSRATWLSIALSLGFYFILVFKIKFRWLFFSFLFVAGIVYLNFNTIMMRLEKNKQDSSKHFVEHVQSITNIRTDASNLERINRWKAAFRMVQDYPIFGTGAGTYQFLYAPYQKSKDRTIISTNAGTLGNAHSEYITPLVERGVFGLLFFLGIIVSVYITGIRAYNRLKDKELRMIIAVILTGLFSYLMHGFMNNFLDTENANVIFWGFIAIIVRLSILQKMNQTE